MATTDAVQLPDWKKVPKQALTDAIRNTHSVPISSNLTRQDKGDLTDAVVIAWKQWDDDARGDFLRKLNTEIEYQRDKRRAT